MKRLAAALHCACDEDRQLLVCVCTCAQHDNFPYWSHFPNERSLGDQSARAPQNIEDVEEGTEGAMTRFAEAAGLMEQLRANVNALHTCRSFHLSYIYTRVKPPPHHDVPAKQLCTQENLRLRCELLLAVAGSYYLSEGHIACGWLLQPCQKLMKGLQADNLLQYHEWTTNWWRAHLITHQADRNYCKGPCLADKLDPLAV